jgi:hypothetical protein
VARFAHHLRHFFSNQFLHPWPQQGHDFFDVCACRSRSRNGKVGHGKPGRAIMAERGRVSLLRNHPEPLVFATIHFGAGSGVLSETVAGWGERRKDRSGWRGGEQMP